MSADRIGSDLMDAEGDPSGQVLDHAAQAQSKLIYFFQGKERLMDWVSALCGPVQDLSDLVWAVYILDADPETLSGIWLDYQGALLGESRKDRTDTQYRPVLAAIVKANNSDGQIEQLYEILGLISYAADKSIQERYPAALLVELSDLNGARALDIKALLMRAKAGGVSLDFGYGGGVLGDIDGDPEGFTLGDVDGDPEGGDLGSGS